MAAKTKLLLAALAIATVSTTLSIALFTDARPLGQGDLPAAEPNVLSMFADIDFLAVFVLPQWSVLAIVSIVSTFVGAAIARTKNPGHPQEIRSPTKN